MSQSVPDLHQTSSNIMGMLWGLENIGILLVVVLQESTDLKTKATG